MIWNALRALFRARHCEPGQHLDPQFVEVGDLTVMRCRTCGKSSATTPEEF